MQSPLISPSWTASYSSFRCCEIGRCDTQSESRRVSESRGDPPRVATRDRAVSARDLACGPRRDLARGPRREIARDIARLCTRCRVRCREHSRVQPRGAASHAFSGAIAHAASRATSHATSHTFSHLFSLAGRPASRAAPASDASCQAIGGRNGSLSPRGERGISDDLAPRPQPLPRAVPAAGTSAECAAKLYWHPLSSTRWRGSWGSCTAAGGGDRRGEGQRGRTTTCPRPCAPTTPYALGWTRSGY